MSDGEAADPDERTRTMTTTTAKKADHYIVEWTYWAAMQQEKFETLNDAMAKREQELGYGSSMVRVMVVFTDGTRDYI